MRFDLKSVLLHDGVVIKVKVHPPEVFSNLKVPIVVWHKAVLAFNKQLNERNSVTEEINNSLVDILQMDDRDVLQLAVRKEDAERFDNTWFSIKGQIVFKASSESEVEEIVISDLIYKDSAGKPHGILNKS
jgi:wyosine [tRNA(Phe)-imidazoG37] synthetase (radical SAM superfamily)